MCRHVCEGVCFTVVSVCSERRWVSYCVSISRWFCRCIFGRRAEIAVVAMSVPSQGPISDSLQVLLYANYRRPNVLSYKENECYVIMTECCVFNSNVIDFSVQCIPIPRFKKESAVQFVWKANDVNIASLLLLSFVIYAWNQDASTVLEYEFLHVWCSHSLICHIEFKTVFSVNLPSGKYRMGSTVWILLYRRSSINPELSRIVSPNDTFSYQLHVWEKDVWYMKQYWLAMYPPQFVVFSMQISTISPLHTKGNYAHYMYLVLLNKSEKLHAYSSINLKRSRYVQSGLMYWQLHTSSRLSQM